MPAAHPRVRGWRRDVLSDALPGLVGSMLLLVGSLGVGWLPASSQLLDTAVVTALRATAAGAGLSRIAVFLGVALLVQAWFRLGQEIFDARHPDHSDRTAPDASSDPGADRTLPDRTAPDRTAPDADADRTVPNAPVPALAARGHDVSRLNAILAIWTVPLILMPPLFSRDAYSYYAQGQLLLAGLSPYRQGVSALPGWFESGADPLWAEAPTPYGPAFLLIEQGVAALVGSNAYAGAVIFRLVALTGVALLAVHVPRLAYRHGIPPAKAHWLAVLNPLVLMHFVAGAHNDALMVGLLVAGMAVTLDGAPLRGLGLIALAGAVKPIALLVLPFAGLIWAGVRAGWAQRFWAWVRSGAVVAVVFLVLSAVAAVGLGWIASLSTPGTVRTWLSPATALGMVSGWLLETIGLASTDAAVSAWRGLAMLVGAALCLFLVLRPEGRPASRGAALALLAVVALGPVVQPWYLLWCLPLLAATGLTSIQLRLSLLVTLVLVIHGMAESNATADTLVDVRDGLAAVLAVAIVGVVLLRPPARALDLLIGPHHELAPEDAEGKARWDSLLVQARATAADPNTGRGSTADSDPESTSSASSS